MILRMILERPIQGFWDGGAKEVFDFSIDSSVQSDKHGAYIRVGSWAANHWFNVALGKTVKATLGHARRKLAAAARRDGIPARFEYVPETPRYFERQAFGEGDQA